MSATSRLKAIDVLDEAVAEEEDDEDGEDCAAGVVWCFITSASAESVLTIVYANPGHGIDGVVPANTTSSERSDPSVQSSSDRPDSSVISMMSRAVVMMLG
jgi:hypothetical protein